MAIKINGGSTNFASTFTASPTADRTVTVPDASFTLMGASTTDTLTNKTIDLGSNTVSGTLAQFNTAVTDADLASLAGTETLTNKTLTSPRIGTAVLDTNGNEVFAITATASAVNDFTIVNAATGNAPQIQASGNDANVGINLVPKGSGAVQAGGVPVVTTTGTQTLTNKTVEAGTFTNGYTEETVTANTGTAYTIDLANGSVQILTLTGNCTFTFPTATAGRSFMLILKQDGTGSRTVTWPSSTNPVKWPAGTAPTITSTASRSDKFVFTADGTNWIGSNAGQNYTL